MSNSRDELTDIVGGDDNGDDMMLRMLWYHDYTKEYAGMNSYDNKQIVGDSREGYSQTSAADDDDAANIMGCIINIRLIYLNCTT